jgi:hypothetical protein
MYIHQVWKVQWVKDGKQVQKQFKSLEEAKAYRFAELGF